MGTGAPAVEEVALPYPRGDSHTQSRALVVAFFGLSDDI